MKVKKLYPNSGENEKIICLEKRLMLSGDKNQTRDSSAEAREIAHLKQWRK